MIDKKDPEVKKLMALTLIQSFALIIKICRNNYSGVLTLDDLKELQKEMYRKYKSKGLLP